MLTILDLDNCISDDSWRINLIDYSNDNLFERYHSYHSLALLDEYCNKHLVHKARDIIVVTSRPDLYRPATVHWLRCNDINPISLLMRPNDNHDESHILKRKLLLDCAFNLNRVSAAYDDNEAVIKTYLELKLPAQKVSIY